MINAIRTFYRDFRAHLNTPGPGYFAPSAPTPLAGLVPEGKYNYSMYINCLVFIQRVCELAFALIEVTRAKLVKDLILRTLVERIVQVERTINGQR